MKYIDEFRDHRIANAFAQAISAQALKDRSYHLMEFCGGHTHTIYRYGLPSLLPSNVKMMHGPGCPVCVLPIARIDYAIALAKKPEVILCSYADMLRVPGSHQQSLLHTKAQGADVRMIYSVDDVLQIALRFPHREIVFFAIGFETTTPPTAAAILTAKQQKLKNFSVFCNHVLTPVAMRSLLSQKPDETHLDGFIGPAHVSIIVGSQAYQSVADDYCKPIVIAGFEPLDVLQSILMLIQLVNENKHGVQNQYTRAVSPEGNRKSQAMMQQVFELRDQFEWRGLGWIPNSALKINTDYQDFDAELRFPITVHSSEEHRACECPAILRGAKNPLDCKLFAVVCTPSNPLGACMVSSEGACAAYYTYVTHQRMKNHHENPH
jgi:hydrogenase expression/formation protein HypD